MREGIRRASAALDGAMANKTIDRSLWMRGRHTTLHALVAAAALHTAYTRLLHGPARSYSTLALTTTREPPHVIINRMVINGYA